MSGIVFLGMLAYYAVAKYVCPRVVPVPRENTVRTSLSLPEAPKATYLHHQKKNENHLSESR